MDSVDTQEFFPETNLSPTRDVVLEIRNLRKYFPVKSRRIIFSRNIGSIKAVDGIDLQVYKGEILGLVGETGCGKSTLARLIAKLDVPSAGQILYHDKDIAEFRTREKLLKYRRSLQLIFQDPYSSLNPRMQVHDILKEPLHIHFPHMGQKEVEERIGGLLDLVGLEKEHARRYPHEFSGGQRQRIGIARAILSNPEVIVADEPVSALDVSVQASVLNLLQSLQEEFGLTMIFIAHDLGVIRHMTSRVAVMYLGKIVELAPTESLFSQPGHPYTVALLSAIPQVNPNTRKKRILLKGDVPSPINIPEGCSFADRCYKVQEKCYQQDPPLQLMNANQYVACHFPEIDGYEGEDR